MGRIQPLLITSIVVAGVGGFGPFVFQSDPALWLSLGLSVVWVSLVTYGIFRHTKRGLWLLIGLPFALYWPFAVVMLNWACAKNINACP